MKNILKTLMVAIIATILTACGNPAAEPDATVSAPVNTVTIEATPSASITLSSTPVPTSSVAVATPTAEPASPSAAVTPSESSDVASAPTATPAPAYNIDPEWFENWYQEKRDNVTPTKTPDNAPVNVVFNNTITDSGIGWLVTAYDFTNAMKSGSSIVTSDKQVSSFSYEGRYGLDAYVVGTKLYVKAYSNMDFNPAIKSTTLTDANGKVSFINGINYSDYTEVDLAGKNQTCTVKTTFDYNGFSVANNMYVYVNGNEAWLCKLTPIDKDNFKARRNAIMNIMNKKGITPENSTDIDCITYPHSNKTGYRCDTNLWADLSKTIITNDAWSNEYKVVLIHDWIVNNIAYDRYKADMDHARDYLNNDFTGTYSVYQLRTGTCYDISNIFAIMCRHNGIPCVTVEDDTHMWNAVFLNGNWHEIDLTDDIHRFTKTKDATAITTIAAPGYDSLNEHQDNDVLYINDSLKTW